MNKIRVTFLLSACLLMSVSLLYPQEQGSKKMPRGYFTIKMAGQLMDACDVKPGMIIGEAGAGKGDFAFKLSERVGHSGKIYANEIQKKYLDLIDERCKKEGVKNIETILGKTGDPLFPKGSLDMVIMIHVFHDLEKPVEFMTNVRSALKKGGRVVILDYRKYMPKETAMEKLGRAGYELVRIETFIPHDYIYIFRSKD